MISVDQALSHLFLLTTVMPVEHVPLTQATGRVLAQDVRAARTQPPFAASAMDGYAVRGADVAAGARLRVIGEAAAGHGFDGLCAPGDAVRIFTGAPVPTGADRVIIQEHVTRDGDAIVINDASGPDYIRPAGDDFDTGTVLAAPTVLTPAQVALLAAMNIAEVPVRRKPVVAVIATGDELVTPGQTPGPDQIIASNSYGLHGLIAGAGAVPRLLPIAPDRKDALAHVFGLAQGADLVVTIGGASVGDHDLVGAVAADLGMERAFYKVRMRPGKPLMAGRMGGAAMVGLPGNPVSAMVCGHIFVLPMLRAMLDLPQGAAPRLRMPLAQGIGPNGPREHYMRARRVDGGVHVFDRQDSALLSVLAQADCLVVRDPDAPAVAAGDLVDIVPIG